jgi:Na+-transporting methylmalonyl-CoA/oxaloacetate decarboxylase gamma subunit
MRSKIGAALVLLVSVTLCMTILFAQTSKKKTATSKTKTTTTAKAKAKADSIAAAAIADSLRRIAAAKAIADSTRRADSLARVAADSAKMFRWRKIENKAFGVGERLVFNVSYGPITAGEAVMAVPRHETIAGRNCYRVEFTVNSLKTFDWIYEVRDRYLTFVDVETVAPLRFEQHIREGTYRRDFVADFDQANHIAKTSEGDYPIPEYVHDIMSAFYYARTLEYAGMKPGDYVTLYNFYRDKSHELRVKFLGRQELEVEAGTFNTIVVEPLVKEGGLFKAEGRIVIWLTDDERKIPIRVNTKVVIGSIDTELREYYGLIGPVKSRVK